MYASIINSANNPNKTYSKIVTTFLFKTNVFIILCVGLLVIRF